jgi:MSHA biogenesis protein MshP
MFNKNQTHTPQQGSVLIVALFVILVLALLAANLTRMNWSNQDTLTREVLGTQAWFLAHSSNEWAIAQLYPLTASSSSVAELCEGIDGSTATEEMLSNNDLACTAPTISCRAIPQDLDASDIPEELQFIKVTSRARCSDGSKFEVERVQEVWLKGDSDV